MKQKNKRIQNISRAEFWEKKFVNATKGEGTKEQCRAFAKDVIRSLEKMGYVNFYKE